VPRCSSRQNKQRLTDAADLTENGETEAHEAGHVQPNRHVIVYINDEVTERKDRSRFIRVDDRCLDET